MFPNTGTNHHLYLQGGRKLSYAQNGDTSSSTVVLFFHGALSIGDASDSCKPIVEKGVHYVAPTLPGWGTSSPVPLSASYASTLAADINALLVHLYPDDPNLKLYIGGGSYGTVAAQILYGAPFDIFPMGRHIVKLCLLGSFSPFKYDTNYGKSLSWQNYIFIGPPSRYDPFHLVPRLASTAMSWQLGTQEKAEKFIHDYAFKDMDEAERAEFARWQATRGKVDGQFEREMAANIVESVAHSWRGFIEIADVLHSDWGFRPDALDEEHACRPVLIVCSEGDVSTPKEMAHYLARTYKNARLKTLSGGHLASLYHLDKIWSEVLENEG